MPIPVFVIAGAAIAGAFGAGNAIYGGIKIKDAKGKEKAAGQDSCFFCILELQSGLEHGTIDIEFVVKCG